MIQTSNNDNTSAFKSNKWIIISLWSIAIMAMAFLILTSHSTEQKNQLLQEQNSSPGIKSDVNNLGISTSEFTSHFNTAAISFNSDLKLPLLKIQSGIAQDTFSYTLSKNINIMGTIDNDGNLLSVTLFGFSDGTLSTNTDIALSIVILIAALNPELSTKDCYHIAKETGLTDNQLSSPSQITRQGKRYFFMRADESNLMFTISKAAN